MYGGGGYVGGSVLGLLFEVGDGVGVETEEGAEVMVVAVGWGLVWGVEVVAVDVVAEEGIDDDVLGDEEATGAELGL